MDAPAGFERVAAVPLVVGDERLGVALVFNRNVEVLDSGHLERIARIAEAAATAILNSQLHAQSRRELRRRDALRRVVASISSELDLDSLFDRVIGSAVELLDADSGVISLIDDDGAARVRAVHNLASEYADYLAKRLVNDLALESGVAVPIWWQDRVIGVFGVLASGSGYKIPTRAKVTLTILNQP